MPTLKGKVYRAKGQGLGKKKAAKKWLKRRWRRAMNRRDNAE